MITYTWSAKSDPGLSLQVSRERRRGGAGGKHHTATETSPRPE